MAQRKIVIHEKAENAFRKVAAWYCINCGYSYSTTFVNDTTHTYEVLATMPTIGKCVKKTSTRCYAEYVAHPLVIVRYWFNDEEIHFLNLIFTRQTKR